MKQAMIFAAGLGTRLKPLTDTMPKALVKVGGQPLLWHVLMKLKAAGYERLVVNVHHFADQIIDYIEDNHRFGLDIRISDERDGLLDTGGGIKKALPLFDQDSPILIHNVDILSNLDLNAHGGSPPVQFDCTGGLTPCAVLVVSERKTNRYLQFVEKMRLVGWKNIATGEVKGCEGHPLAFSGIHMLYPSLFPLIKSWPERFPIMDFYLNVCGDHLIQGFEPHGLQLMDVGKLDTLQEAETFINQL